LTSEQPNDLTTPLYNLFNHGIHLGHGLKSNIKNKLMLLWDKMILRKRIIECINELLKNMANLIHSRHRSVHNFLMILCAAAFAAYSLFEEKPKTLPCALKRVGNWSFSKPVLLPNWHKIFYLFDQVIVKKEHRAAYLKDIPLCFLCYLSFTGQQYFKMNNSPLRLAHFVRSDDAKIEGF